MSKTQGRIRIVIVGGVAAGATAAARARRVSEDAEIVVVERGPFVSYANCGLPYFVSGDIKERSSLLLQSVEGFDARYRVKVLLRTEAVAINRAEKSLRVQNADGSDSHLSYDKLILAQGGTPVVPNISGANAPHAFTLWTIPQMDEIDRFIVEKEPKTAVVVGGGFIGVEMAEAFQRRGLDTTVVEFTSTVLPPFDLEVGRFAAREMAANRVRVETGVGVASVEGGDALARSVVLTDGRTLPADLVLFSVGVRPELTLAREAGLTLGDTGAVLVDDFMTTSDPDILAAGDMVEVVHRVSGRKVRLPLAGPANRQGRIVASNALGLPMRYDGATGTSVAKVFDATAGATGLTEKAARSAGFDARTAVVHKGHHAGYYPGAMELTVRVVYERATGRILGGQAFGKEGVDKRIDVLATALHGKMTVDDLARLDLAYAPPYSSANDPLNIAGFAAVNDMTGFAPLASAGDLRDAFASGGAPFVLDVRNGGEFKRGRLATAVHIPLDELRGRIGELPVDRRIFVHCRTGQRSHLATRIMRQAGRDAVNVTGGFLSLCVEGGFEIVGAAL